MTIPFNTAQGRRVGWLRSFNTVYSLRSAARGDTRVALVLLDLIAARTGLRGFRAEGGALLAAFGATAVTVLVAQLPALQWLWLAGVGLAAATAAFVMVIGQRR